jgi:glycosyltransferase involved in cell wall biosynthesis
MKVLFTNAWMRNFGGSELVTLELAEEFQRQGHEVLIYTPQIGGDLNITVPFTTKKPDTSDFDLIWVHHNMLIHDLGFKKRMSQQLVFNHMSSYVGTEFPRIVGYENAMADWILANSWETKAALEYRGVHEIELFQNPAPMSFGSIHPIPTEKGLIVSNHMAEELEPLGVTHIGGNFPQRLRHDLLCHQRFVICNGKTVQYALRAGVPVYLYDHFGGCGWLTNENFDTAERFNFSGRGFGEDRSFSIAGITHRTKVLKKTTDEIREELKQVPNAMPCPDRFKLEFRLKELEIC